MVFFNKKFSKNFNKIYNLKIIFNIFFCEKRHENGELRYLLNFLVDENIFGLKILKYFKTLLSNKFAKQYHFKSRPNLRSICFLTKMSKFVFLMENIGRSLIEILYTNS